MHEESIEFQLNIIAKSTVASEVKSAMYFNYFLYSSYSSLHDAIVQELLNVYQWVWSRIPFPLTFVFTKLKLYTRGCRCNLAVCRPSYCTPPDQKYKSFGAAVVGASWV